MALALALGSTACTAQTGDKAMLPPKAAAPEQPAATEEQPQETAAAPVETKATTAPAKPVANATAYRLTGEVTSTRKSQIAFRVGGYIDNVAAKAGMLCKKGDVLATLDDRDYVLSLELARAKRDLAKVALGSAPVELQREEELKKQNASTATV